MDRRDTDVQDLLRYSLYAEIQFPGFTRPHGERISRVQLSPKERLY
jgi:hypothetical protein